MHVLASFYCIVAYFGERRCLVGVRNMDLRITHGTLLFFNPFWNVTSVVEKSIGRYMSSMVS